MKDLRREVAAAAAAGAAAMDAARGTEELIAVRDETGRVYAPFPICGFAWVRVRPGKKRALGNALKRAGFRAAYPSGLDYWVTAGGQSYDLKLAYARGMAAKLNELVPELDFYADGRLD